MSFITGRHPAVCTSYDLTKLADAAQVTEVVTTTDPETAFAGADVAILLGGFPRLPVRSQELGRVHAGSRLFAVTRDQVAVGNT